MAGDARGPADKFGIPPGGATVTQCLLCDRLAEGPGRRLCQAFPGGIPDAIITNDFDHRRPYVDPETGQPADTGIRGGESLTFVPRADAHPEALKALDAYFARRAEAARRKALNDHLKAKLPEH